MSRGLLIPMAAGGLLASLVAMPVSPLHAQALPAAKADTNRADTNRANVNRANAKVNAKTNVKSNLRADMKADDYFVREVAADNLLEVRLGELAQRKGTDAAVKQFGQRMVADHTKANQDLLNVASKGGLSFKPGLGPKHEQKIDRLQKLDKKAFDRAYAALMIQSHNDDVSYFQNEGKAAHAAPVRNYVDRTLPILQQHLSMAKQLAVKVGADTTGASTTAAVKK